MGALQHQTLQTCTQVQSSRRSAPGSHNEPQPGSTSHVPGLPPSPDTRWRRTCASPQPVRNEPQKSRTHPSLVIAYRWRNCRSALREDKKRQVSDTRVVNMAYSDGPNAETTVDSTT